MTSSCRYPPLKSWKSSNFAPSHVIAKGKGAFVHNGKWEGLKGLEPLWPEGQRGLELSWKEELVDQLRSKIKARPINPKLYAACKEEFERLRGYIYISNYSTTRYLFFYL